MNYKPALDAFLASSKDFAFVYKSVKIASHISRIHILDSSFNPPHMAHFTLAKEALEYDFGDSGDSTETQAPRKNSSMLMLLLSVKNADKHVPSPASFEHRLAMMHLMAKSLEKLEVPVTIALTKHARFADKSAAIQNSLNGVESWYTPNSRLTFLLGFDTLVRVLDPRYYAPASLADSLKDFMVCTDLFCLTRAGSKEEFEIQQRYLSQISRGEFPEIPRAWADKIHLKTVETDRDSIGEISSSGIRQAYTSERNPRDLPLLQEIDEYIQSNRLYS